MMKLTTNIHVGLMPFLLLTIALLALSCDTKKPDSKPVSNVKEITAKEILGNPAYRAISYGGYRQLSRDEQPTVEQLKEDMKILHAMGIRLLRTYNVTRPHASNVLAAIRALKKEDSSFEMYVMLGAWINCEGAFADSPDHTREDAAFNSAEVQRAVTLANDYADIVKIIAVGNEAMVKWAAPYFVQPSVILKYVKQLQALKQEGKLNSELWITSSDNFASWGGGDEEYHVADLEELIRTVDFVSLHTYPMHDTHYNPDFWGTFKGEDKLPKNEQIAVAMARSLAYAQNQFNTTKKYIRSLGVNSPIHIGETGWASASNSHYGPEGSKATDEYKEGLYHKAMRAWTDGAGITCFYFEAFDEIWKDAANPGGSENHFGLFTLDGKAKFALWDEVDKGTFSGLTRGGNPITKTYDGDIEKLLADVEAPLAKLDKNVPE